MTSIKLSQPIARESGKPVTEITLRKPVTGELRGLKLLDLMQLDVSALGTLLPRIAQPTITPEEYARLALEDVSALGVEVVGFFAPKPDSPTT